MTQTLRLSNVWLFSWYPHMTHDHSDYFTFHQQLLSEFAARLPEALSEVVQEEQKLELIANLETACQELKRDRALAQNWLFSFICMQPQLNPLVPRDLLWFIGGDCLHFLIDEEIERFQKIEDLVAETPNLSWVEALQMELPILVSLNTHSGSFEHPEPLTHCPL